MTDNILDFDVNSEIIVVIKAHRANSATMAREIVTLCAELEAARARIVEADSALCAMVRQYNFNYADSDPSIHTYSHDFMSAGEEAFEYLVKHGLAKLTENGVHIYFAEDIPQSPGQEGKE